MQDFLVQQMITNANAAAEFAIQVREAHRKRTKPGNKSREQDLRVALHRLRVVMRPMRSALVVSPFRESPLTPLQQMELKEASKIVQRERRKLWKMKKESMKRKRRRRVEQPHISRESDGAGPRKKGDPR